MTFPAEKGEKLTPTEQQVYDLIVCDGLSTKEVADSLCKKERTVKYHLTNIYMRLGVQNRTQMIVNHYQALLKEAA